MSLLLCLIFFLSGASALIFETLWFRLAGLSLGNSVWASSLVLASFMAGLALGNLLAGVYGPRWKRPLLVYAVIEVAVGVTGLGIVLGLPWLTPVLAPVFGPLLENPLALNVVRLLIAFLLLVIPSTAMGATLPVLVKTMSAREPNFGRVLGRLYGWNTLGAVCGALSAELILIETLGMRFSGVAAACLNLAAAAMAFRLARPEAHAPEPLSEPEPASGIGTRAAWTLAAAFLAGAILLGLEVVWFRFLLLFVQGTGAAFAMMLAVVLSGIALGGLAASWWLGASPKAHRFVPLIAVGAGVLTAFMYMRFDDGYGLYGASAVKPVADPWIVFGLALGLAGPVSVASGLLFTFLGRSLQEKAPDVTRATAAVTFANTLGAMVGPLVAGFVLIPFVGMEVSLFLFALGYGGVALASFASSRGEVARSEGETLALVGAGVLFALFLALFPFGLMNNHYVPQVIATFTGDGSRMVEQREGVTETIFYLRRDFEDEPLYFTLLTNGYSMSSNKFHAKRYMELYAYWPFAVHPSIQRALLISYGVGNTAFALARSQELQEIDVVDISRDVLELSQKVEAFGEDHPLDDPRVTVHVEDGRFFLLTSEGQYDLITAEPPPPRIAGVVNLYSAEYFELLYDRLAPGGIATYWLPVHQLDVEESRAIARAFCDAFIDCSLWNGTGLDWMLVGSRGLEGPVSEEAFTRPWRDPRIGPRLRAIGIEEPGQLGALFLGDALWLNEWIGDTPPLADDYPYRLRPDPRTDAAEVAERIASYVQVMDTAGAKRRFADSELIAGLWPSELREPSLDSFEIQDALNRYADRKSDVRDVYRLLDETALTTLPLILMDGNPEYRYAFERPGVLEIKDPSIQYLLASFAMSDRDFDRAVVHFDRALELAPSRADWRVYRTVALHLGGHDEAALEAARALWLAPSRPNDAALWAWLEGRLGEPIRDTTADPALSDR